MAIKALGLISPPRGPKDQKEVVEWCQGFTKYMNEFLYSLEETIDAVVAASVTETELADSGVTSAKIADSAVTSVEIADGTIATIDLANSAVTTVIIANSAVTAAKIADGTLTSAEYGVTSIYSSALQDGSVTTIKRQAITTLTATANIGVNTAAVVSFTVTEARTPLVTPRCTALTHTIYTATVSTSLVEVIVRNHDLLVTAGVTVYIDFW